MEYIPRNKFENVVKSVATRPMKYGWVGLVLNGLNSCSLKSPTTASECSQEVPEGPRIVVGGLI